MSTINVGKVRPTHKGAYSASAAYVFLDWVTDSGSSYVCINLQGAPAGTAVTNETYWALLAQKGDTGAAGANGTNGTTPTFSIGTVTTGAAGSNAAVTISGTAPNYTLNFTIPRGATGATGATGASGVFTGPLKPTTSYWQSFQGGNLPSGGTWAYAGYTVSYAGDSSGNYQNHVGVAAGGTYISGAFGGHGHFCWRIQ